MEKERILHLYKAYQLQTATKEEELEFAKLLHDTQYEEIFNEILDGNWAEITEQELQGVDFAGYAPVMASLKQQLSVSPKRRKLWSSIAAAAAILLAVLGVSFFWISNKNLEEIHFANDIAPGKNGATLTLADGRKILINDALAGNIASEAGVRIFKNENGQIVYEVVGDHTGALTYNTLTTTRGEQTQIRLPDGTVVFLNAESALRFPTSFTGTVKRKVSLSGEGYFEVSKDKDHPFIVESDQQEIEVLGTSFNINNYSDEPLIKTTLLEGSVRITNLNTKAQALLVPGQQATVNGDKLDTKTVETEDIVAWKNGYFMFNNETLASIMKRVSKWYDMEVVYNDDALKNKRFFGSISRYGNISELLKVLQKTEVATFEIKGRQVIVNPE
mgnify:CR=1 FL=1